MMARGAVRLLCVPCAVFLVLTTSCASVDAPSGDSPTAEVPSSSVQAIADEPETISREQWLSYAWQGEGEPPEPLPVVREAGLDEYLDAVAACMEEAGWPNLTDEANSTYFEVPAGQRQVFAEAQYQCYAQYPLAPQYYQRYNLDQLKALWTYQVGEMAECLAEQGFAPEEPPTFERFASDYQNDVVPRWFPYDNVPDSRFHEIEERCPAEPDGFYDLATVPH